MENERSIFVSIASYSDPDINNTVNDLFKKAAYPGRIYVGVVEQSLPGIFGPTFRFNPRPRAKILRFNEAKGPGWARFHASTLYNGEDYYLQIDSHMRFIRNWDTIIIPELLGLPERSILSGYPMGNNQSLANLTKFTNICTGPAKLKNGHIVSSWKQVAARTKCTRGIQISAAFIFSKAPDFLDSVPYDPCLEYIFQGEEVLLSMRLYTSGYKVYYPKHCLCNHKYGRHNQPKVWFQRVYSDNNPKALRRYFTMIDPKGSQSSRLYGSRDFGLLKEWYSMVVPEGFENKFSAYY